MTRDEAIRRLFNIERCTPIHTREDVRDFEALEMAIKALEQEPKYCDRNICVSNEYNGIGCDECEVTKSQKPKIGHWIQTNESFINQDGQFIYNFICSECKSLSYFRKSNKKVIGADVCPSCGAKMVEPQESEE